MPPTGHLPPSTQPRTRVRIQRACAPCQKRKIKCDGSEPCAACAGYGYDCVYAEHPPRKRHAASSPVQTIEASEPETVPTQKKPKETDAPFLSSETNVQDPMGQSLLQQSLKTRFTSAYSSIAWPKTIGLSLGMLVPPRLQSFAWNPGNRPESNILPQSSIRDIISLEEMKLCADVFFQTVHPFFGILNQGMFEKRSLDFWFSQQEGTGFEACVCGVVALGSYFSSVPSRSEAQVVEQGKLLLDLTISCAPGLLSVKHVVAWVLRAIYLRCTTRPHLSWMASNNAVHIAEALGLHREFSEIYNTCEKFRNVTSLEMDLRRRTFWVAMALNQFFASEYGRTRVYIDFVGTKPLTPQDGDFTAETVAILQSVPRTQSLPGNSSDLVDVLSKATALPAKAPFLVILRADACFCGFRMLSSANAHIPAAEMASLLEVIRVALDAVMFLRTMGSSWWNLVFTPFHSVCVLLTIGTSESLTLVPKAMETLRSTTDKYPSHLSTEALQTAHSLVQATREKRRKELESLDEGLSMVGEISQPLLSNGNAIFGTSNFEWSMNNDLGVSDYLDLGAYYGNIS